MVVLEVRFLGGTSGLGVMRVALAAAAVAPFEVPVELHLPVHRLAIGHLEGGRGGAPGDAVGVDVQGVAALELGVDGAGRDGPGAGVNRNTLARGPGDRGLLAIVEGGDAVLHAAESGHGDRDLGGGGLVVGLAGVHRVGVALGAVAVVVAAIAGGGHQHEAGDHEVLDQGHGFLLGR